MAFRVKAQLSDVSLGEFALISIGPTELTEFRVNVLAVLLEKSDKISGLPELSAGNLGMSKASPFESKGKLFVIPLTRAGVQLRHWGRRAAIELVSLTGVGS